MIFEVKDLVKLVKTGQWRVAASYIIGFVPSDSMSDAATQLLLFIQDLMSLSDFAQGVTIMACLLSDWVLSIYKEPVLAEYPCFATLVADVLFLRSDHARYGLSKMPLPCIQVPKKKVAGGFELHCFSLRGSDYGFSRLRKNLRTLAHARESQALRRAQREDFFLPTSENSWI